MTDGDQEEERYGRQRPNVAEMQSRCDREGGTLQLDPATGLLSACVSSATGRVLFRETHYHDDVADGSAPAPPHTERERLVRYFCMVYPSSRERHWRALTTEELGALFARLEVHYELPNHPHAIRAKDDGTTTTPQRRHSHRTAAHVAGMSGLRLRLAPSTQEPCTGYAPGSCGEVLTFEGAQQQQRSVLMYGCRGSGTYYRLGAATLTFGNAVQALLQVATTQEIVSALCAQKRDALRHDDEAAPSWLQDCASGAGVFVDGVNVQPTFEEDDGLFDLLVEKYGPTTDTLQFNEQPAALHGGRQHALVLLAIGDLPGMVGKRVLRLDPFDDAGRITLRNSNPP